MGPDGVFSASFCLVMAGIVEKDVVYKAVSVVVVFREVNLLVEQLAGLVESFVGFVITVAYVFSVIRVVVRERDGTVYVECGDELAGRVEGVEILHGPGSTVGGVAFLVEQAGKGVRGVVECKMQVVEFYEQDEEVLFSE